MRRARKNRRGAAVLELAIVLVVFILLTFGMFDLGLGVFRYHILTNAARQAARRAIVHGTNANVLGVWGPSQVSVQANANGTPIVDGSADGIQSMLILCDLEKTTITLDWIDHSNAVGSRVRATVISPYQPFMTMLLLWPVTLEASSTMQIAH
jgi:Flp pilus assembly protein TadG